MSAGKYGSSFLDRVTNVDRLKGYVNLPYARHLEDAFALAVAGLRIWSTTTNTYTVTLSYQTGPPLELSCQSSYGTPDFLFWRVAYGKDQFMVVSGAVRNFYLRRVKRKERVQMDGLLLLRMGELWVREQEKE